jgi:crotonobetainyl-CoA:carnitine CoA-transferase CaiB-like acyl-CoA transferase
MDRPLSDVVVLDLTRALSGPIASRLLADLGAEVIKVEPPDGDLTRFIVPHVDGMSAYYVQYNAGKRCVSVDLSHPEGRELLLSMVERADIVFENYRPGVMARLGLTYDVLAARNPRIILASISGWGHGNSRSHQGAFASVIHAEAGVTEMIARRRGEGDRPRNDPMPHADTYGGLHALAAVLAALHMRDRTGKGQAVEVSMAESTLMVNDLASIELTGAEPEVGFRAGQNWSGIYRLGNGRHVSVTMDCATDGGFDTWCALTGRDDWRRDPRFVTAETRVANRAALQAEIGSWVVTHDALEDLQTAIGPGVLAAEVRTVPELASTPWATERGAFVPVDIGRGHEVVVPQSPWRFSAADTGVGSVVGFRGEHNREVLQQFLGLDDADVDRLVAAGVLSERVPDHRRDAG